MMAKIDKMEDDLINKRTNVKRTFTVGDVDHREKLDGTVEYWDKTKSPSQWVNVYEEEYT